MPAVKPLSDKDLQELFGVLEKEESFVFLETTRVTTDNQRSLLFTREVDRLVCNVGDSPFDFLDRASSFLKKGYYLAGWFSYEFGYLLEEVLSQKFDGFDPDLPLAELGVYNQPYVYDHAINGFFGPDDTMMPERGGNSALTDAEVKAAVDYMVALANYYIQMRGN